MLEVGNYLILPFAEFCGPQNITRLPVFVGRGYDLLRGNPLSDTVDPGFTHSIFDNTYLSSTVTEDGKYLVPDGVTHKKVSSCSFSSTVKIFRGTKSYQEDLKTKVRIGAGYNGLVQAAFSASTGF